MKLLPLLLLLPNLAYASWEVEVLDKQTREIKKYALADEEQFNVPLPIKNVFCFSLPQKAEYKDGRFIFSRSLQCDYSDFSVYDSTIKIIGLELNIPINFSIAKKDKEFNITLRYI